MRSGASVWFRSSVPVPSDESPECDVDASTRTVARVRQRVAARRITYRCAWGGARGRSRRTLEFSVRHCEMYLGALRRSRQLSATRVALRATMRRFPRSLGADVTAPANRRCRSSMTLCVEHPPARMTAACSNRRAQCLLLAGFFADQDRPASRRAMVCRPRRRIFQSASHHGDRDAGAPARRHRTAFRPWRRRQARLVGNSETGLSARHARPQCSGSESSRFLSIADIR